MNWRKKARLAWNKKNPLPEGFSHMGPDRRAIIEDRNLAFNNEVITPAEFDEYMRRIKSDAPIVERPATPEEQR